MKTTSAVTVASAGMAALLAAGCGTPGAPAGRTADAAVRVHACTAKQLGFSYIGGEASAGNDFGALAVWDRSATRCALTSPITITGSARSGRKVTIGEKFHVAGPDVLTAHGRGPGRNRQLQHGESAAYVTLIAEYRDDRSRPDGLCTAAHQIEPATWRIALPAGAVVMVANADRHDRGLTRNGGLLTCRGQLDTPQPITVITQK